MFSVTVCREWEMNPVYRTDLDTMDACVRRKASVAARDVHGHMHHWKATGLFAWMLDMEPGSSKATGNAKLERCWAPSRSRIEVSFDNSSSTGHSSTFTDFITAVKMSVFDVHWCGVRVWDSLPLRMWKCLKSGSRFEPWPNLSFCCGIYWFNAYLIILLWMPSTETLWSRALDAADDCCLTVMASGSL